MYQYCFSSAGRGNGRGAMRFLMSFVLEPEIVTLAWIDNASVQFPLNIYATKGSMVSYLCLSGSITLNVGSTAGVNTDSSIFRFNTALVKSFRIVEPSAN